jgi:hypothetical protein
MLTEGQIFRERKRDVSARITWPCRQSCSMKKTAASLLS